MGEHKKPRRLGLVAEDLAKEIALEIILGDDPKATVAEMARMPDISYSVTFEQVWRPIKTALLAADRGIIHDIEVVGESVPINARPPA